MTFINYFLNIFANILIQDVQIIWSKFVCTNIKSVLQHPQNIFMKRQNDQYQLKHVLLATPLTDIDIYENSITDYISLVITVQKRTT